MRVFPKVGIQSFKHINTTGITRTVIICCNGKLDQVAYVDYPCCNVDCLVYSQINLGSCGNRSYAVIIVSLIDIHIITCNIYLILDNT